MSYTSQTNDGLAGARSNANADRARRLRRLQTVATVMDTAISVPGTGIRFGADSLLGLVPGAGDVAGAAVGLAIVNEARKLGLPKEKMAKLLYNVGLDAVVGSVPLVGDLFDIYFKSHRRNVQLILDHFRDERN